ncbi:MAG: response regulator transcription factor [Bacteroidales bacterium]|nr:response regulator transcription factor [Bacteroidales bacterium]
MKLKAIIIEDNIEYCNEVEELLNSIENIEVDSCFHSLEEALEYFNNSKKIDLVILDIGLPGKDGISGIVDILSYCPEAKIAMLTIFDDEEKVFNSLKKGACGYLLKGEPEKRFKNAIDEIISGGSYFSPSIAQMLLQFFRKKKFSKVKITKREKEILMLMAEGFPKKQIADILNITFNTVDTHVKNIYKKLHVRCGVEAIVKAYKEGFIKL